MTVMHIKMQIALRYDWIISVGSTMLVQYLPLGA